MEKLKITDQELTEQFERFLKNCDTRNEETFSSDVISLIAESILAQQNASNS